MKKNIAVIGIVGLPANYGGFETLVENLVQSEEFDYHVYCSKFAYTEKQSSYKGASLYYLPFKANGIQSIIYDAYSIFHAACKGHKNLLVLGTSAAIGIRLIKLFNKKIKIVTNIDGLEWKRAKWSPFAKKMLRFFESICVHHSDIVVCDNQAICDYVNATYQIPGRLIAYGGDHAVTACGGHFDQQDYFLGLCRIEPENNVHLILQAMSQLHEKIVFVGNWDASNYGLALKAKYSQCAHITLLDPVYEPEKLHALRANCRAYLHGHSAGGTNPSLVEMMHFGKPIILFDCNYNRATMQNHGDFFSNPEDIQKIIQSQLYLLQDTQSIQSIAQEKYTWHTIRKQYAAVFD